MSLQKGNKTVLQREYIPRIFEELPSFLLSRNQLKSHNDSIRDLGVILSKYRMHDIVGVSLLHKHFDIFSEEVIVRTFEKSNKAIMKPFYWKDCSANVFPYLWKCISDELGVAWYPLEFIVLENNFCPELDILSYSEAFLIELGEELIKNNLQDIFGIVGLYSRSSFSVLDDETVVETTDEVNRVLTLTTQKKMSLDPLTSTKTLWIFPANNE